MRLLAATILLLAAVSAAGHPQHAVVLVYHHVSDKTPAATSVTPEEFEEHLRFLDDSGYTVLALGEILSRFKRGEAVPDKAVAITFDDAYESVLETAAPALNRRGWPFTVFIATDAIDQGLKPYLSWDGLRALKKFGAEFANHSASHTHMIRRPNGESVEGWRKTQRKEIRRASIRLSDELGDIAPLFAFPYGEYDDELIDLVTDLGLKPVGQHSGGMSGEDVVVPRFPVSSRYASLETLKDKLASLPMPVSIVRPSNGVLEASDARPELVLRFNVELENKQSLQCFVAGQPKATIRWEGLVATIRPTQTLRPGRSKYNCTLPSDAKAGRFHWFSYLWMKPESATRWYEE